MKNTNINARRAAQFLIAILLCLFAGQLSASAQAAKYKIGDRVECDVSYTGKYLKGKIIPFDKYDSPNAADYYFHVEADQYPGSDYKCSLKILRPLAAEADQNAALNDTTRNTAQPPAEPQTNQPADSQKTTGKYQIGQRVECDSAGIGKYEKGTVVAFDRYDSPDAADLYYRVRLDSGGAADRAVCRLERLRPLGNAAGDVDPMSKAVKLRVDENNTLLADRELLDCDNIPQPKAANGARPNPQLMEKLIRCLFERPARKGMDGAVTMDVTPLQIGAARKWIIYQDIGSGATPNTLVYPIKTTYTLRSFYRNRIQERITNAVFNCYVNTFGAWSCGLAENKQKGETKDIPVQQ